MTFLFAPPPTPQHSLLTITLGVINHKYKFVDPDDRHTLLNSYCFNMTRSIIKIGILLDHYIQVLNLIQQVP